MRKTLCTAAAVALAFSLCACQGGNQKGGDSSSGGTLAGDSQAEQDGQGTSSSLQTPTVPEPEPTSIEETVIVDESGIRIVAESLSFDASGAPVVKLLIENNSGKDLSFASRYVSLNGYMVDGYFSCDVADGKKAHTELDFFEESLDLIDFDDVASIEFEVGAYETSSFDDYYRSPLITLTTSSADTYTQMYDDSGIVAYDEDGVSIVVKGLTEDSYYGPELVIEVINSGDRDISVYSRNVSINGFMVDGFFYPDVRSGTRAVGVLYFDEDDLEANGIDAIETVDIAFEIYDMREYDRIAETGTTTLNFS